MLTPPLFLLLPKAKLSPNNKELLRNNTEIDHTNPTTRDLTSPDNPNKVNKEVNTKKVTTEEAEVTTKSTTKEKTETNKNLAKNKNKTFEPPSTTSK